MLRLPLFRVLLPSGGGRLHKLLPRAIVHRRGFVCAAQAHSGVIKLKTHEKYVVEIIIIIIVTAVEAGQASGLRPANTNDGNSLVK